MTENFFSLLEIEPSFALNMPALEQAYFREQRRYHPDRFVAKPQAEKNAAIGRSMDINKAYETLKNPLKRAQYLLHLQGIRVGTESDSAKPSQALLIEIMELREALDEGQNIAIDDKINQSLQNIADNYARRAFDEMAQEVLRLGYLTKIKSDHP